MTLEEIFQQLDSILGLAGLPDLYVMLLFLAASASFFILLFLFLIRGSTRSEPKVDSSSNFKIRRIRVKLARLLLPISLLLLIYRVTELLLSGNRTASVGYVSSSILASITIMLLIFFNSDESRYKFLCFIVIFFVLTGPVLELSVLNGAKLEEATQDTMNIYLTGHWSFSYQHPIYDALPLGPVIDVFLVNVMGLNNLTSAILMAISAGVIATATALLIILFCRYLGFSNKVGLLTAMFTSSLPYLQFTLPSSNYSLLFMMAFIALLTKSLTNRFKRSYMLLSYIFLGSAMFAHEMSLLVLIIPVLLLSFKLTSSSVLDERLSKIAWIGSLIFLSINLFTRALWATYGYVSIYIQGLLGRPIMPERISSFVFIPTSVKLVYLIPIAFVGAYVINLVMNFVSQKHLIVGSKSPGVLVSLYGGGALTVFLAGISLFGTVPITRHFGLFAYLCVGLGAAPIFAMLIGMNANRRYVKVLSKVLVMLIILIVALGLLTPHQMPDQYSRSAAERGGLLEDYIVSESIADHGVFGGGIQEIDFVMHTPYFTKYTLGLAISVSRIEYLIASGLERLPSINLTLYDAGELDPSDVENKSLIYNSQYYEVYVKTD